MCSSDLTRFQTPNGTWLYTEMMTGTSAATAAVSGAAAAVWGYRPGLRPYEVMQTLYDAGVTLDPDPSGTARRAEICVSGTVCNSMALRRLSVCDALRRACSAVTDHCFDAAHAPVCATPAAYGPSGPDLTSLAATFTGAETATYDGRLLDTALPGLTLCGHAAGNVFYRSRANSGAYPTDTCPLRQYPSDAQAPWVGPQPTDPVCPECNFNLGMSWPFPRRGTLHVLISTT